MCIRDRSFASSGVPARQNSGMFQVTRAPTLTGHCTLAVLNPARDAASQSVGTRMSSAYQYQPLWFSLRGSKTCLLYTSDAADERSSVDLGGRRIIKKKNTTI